VVAGGREEEEEAPLVKHSPPPTDHWPAALAQVQRELAQFDAEVEARRGQVRGSRRWHRENLEPTVRCAAAGLL
jgi:hypothetical protein